MPLVRMFHWVLIHTCVVGTVPQNVVRGVVGRSVVLPCRYSIKQSGGITDMCWGRGSCPNSKCSEEILRTNGWRVISRISSRYDLKGSVTNGDVSLTIANLNERDRGLYCCRIEIRGWFNDIKNTLTLQVERATTTVPTTTTTTATTATTQIVTTKITTVPLTSRVTHSTPSVSFLTSTPPSPTISTATTGPTAATSSASTAIGFPTTTLPLVDIQSLPATLQDESTESIVHFFTTEMSSFATVATSTPTALPMSNTTGNLESSAISDPTMKIWGFPKYYAGLIVCVLMLCGLLLMAVIKLMKRRKMRKYQLDKIKSLIKQEEEPEQTPAENEGENGFFPL